MRKQRLISGPVSLTPADHVLSQLQKRISLCGMLKLAATRRRYDRGCTNIINIDFSREVIKEMLLKNLRERPQMRWQVMDMLHTKVSILQRW